jgi:hypothetical protein
MHERDSTSTGALTTNLQLFFARTWMDADGRPGTELFYTYETLTVTMLSGKHSGKLGVESIVAPNGRSFSATNLERTLVDLTVRPAYVGGR